MEQPNLSYIRSMSRGDIVFEKKLFDIIKQEFPQEKTIYHENFNSRNFEKAAENVHKLKHKVSILGLEKSYGIATAYENSLKEGDTSLSEDFESILNIITNYLNQV